MEMDSFSSNKSGKKSLFLFYLQKCIFNLSKKSIPRKSSPKNSMFRLVNKLTILAMGLQGFTKCRIPTDSRTWEDDLRRQSL
jgi:hypothetical protein